MLTGNTRGYMLRRMVCSTDNRTGFSTDNGTYTGCSAGDSRTDCGAGLLRQWDGV